jgi:hypothetical protein
MKGNVTCSCGHSWNTSDSSKKDANVCHICGKDNTMKNGGWLDKYQEGGEVENPQRTALFNQDTLTLPKNSYVKYATDKEKSRLKGTSDDEEINKAADWLTNWYSSKGARQRLAESLKTEDPRQVLQDAKDNVNNVYVLRNTVGELYDDDIIKDKNTEFNALISKSNLLHARISAANNELEYKTRHGAYTAGFYKPNGHIINITPGIDDQVLKGTSVHELTHASNLDNYYNNVGEDILKKHPLARTNGMGLFPRFKQPKGTDQGDSQYIKKDGAYPRLMEMRYKSKINPNQVITPKQFEKIKSENSKNDLFRYYTDYDIINMLNHFAANDKPVQSDITTAEYGAELNYNDSNASAGPGFEGDGYSNVGRNYSPAWGGQFQMGGSMPGAVGFMYARTNDPAPSNGKYAKKTKASAQNGAEMRYYQEGLDFKPKSISKNGSKVIKDDRGQWAHPGEITEIGSNQITMQGVPYPVMGVSDTGDTQMMYPNQEYQYDGNSVTEYPMMQDGGVIDSIVSAGKGVVNYFDNLIKTGIDKLSSYDDPKPTTSHTYKKQPDFSNTPDVFDEIIRSGQYGGEAWTNFDKKSKSNDKTDYTSDKNRIKLNTGRFKGANVSSKLIDDLAAAAKRNNIPVGQLLTLAGRESTFGEDQSIRTNLGDMRGQRGYTSAWDVAQDYQPYDANRFLADNKVPGIEVIKNSAGWGYDIVDVNATKEYVNSHPELLKKYKDKLAKTPSLGNKNYFDLSAEFLKKKGVKGYNPGDPNYEKMFNQDYDTLKQDKALMSYLKKKGYKYEQGGQLTKLDQLTNFTNYNTKQPGGWLDKYSD